MPLDRYELIDDQADLASALDWLADLDPIGIDVERADWNRYYRAAALVQIGGDGRVALLDPLRLDDWSPVAAFCAEREVVLHALENDVAPMQALGVDPPVVHDTAIAAALLGMPTGLETLLSEVLGVEMESDKAAMQRADWEKRPLTEEMLVYAAGDVADLPRLWAVLRDKLVEADRWEWYVEELAATIDQPTVEDRRDWTRTKGVGRLDPKARARAKALWEAREDLAKDTDTAPGRIVNDKTLIDLAQKPPKAVRELGRRGVRRQAVRTFGEDIVTALDQGANADPVPVDRNGRRSTDADRELADELRVIRAQVAEEVGLDAGLLCPSRYLLKAVVADPQTPAEFREALGLRDWQWRLLADPFLDALFEPPESEDDPRRD
ncbi:Ribonuclease D [Euzebya pacifica]|uniref:Ribonuclease D n=1 Tax=Euzebya pacifica TaxID=1608957 RepID=A0A346Y228_9ACTN|nr:HRDC domain-containing protein [Euzebya pacifica]AXV08525.1 Ribonuclease D [Euzebya pacifica]